MHRAFTTPLALLVLAAGGLPFFPGSTIAQEAAREGAAPRAGARDAGSGGAEEIGPWLLVCNADSMTDRNECRLLHRRPVEPATPGRAALALEVVDRGGLLLPVVTARNLTIEGAGRGLLALAGTAQLRFPPAPLIEMPCGLEGRSVVCAPRGEDARRAAAELAGAGRVLVRMSALLDAQGEGLEPVELPLSRTAEATARLRDRAPEGSGPLVPPGLDLRDLLGRVMRFFAP